MNTMYLDTATSDRWLFPRGGQPVADERQPHMVRLAWTLEDETGKTSSEACHLVRLPAGVRMANEAAGHTGIYDHNIFERGMDMFNVLSEFAEALGQANIVVAHSWQFHKKVLERSFRYVGMPARDWQETACAMIQATNIVQVPMQSPGGGFKWPSFDQCLERFCGGVPYRPIDPVESGIQRLRAVRVFWAAVRRNDS